MPDSDFFSAVFEILVTGKFSGFLSTPEISGNFRGFLSTFLDLFPKIFKFFGDFGPEKDPKNTFRLRENA